MEETAKELVKESMKELKEPMKELKEPMKEPVEEPVKANTTWIRPVTASMSALCTDAEQPSHDKSCKHEWVIRSHPTIPYSGAFCTKCDVEKSA